MDLFWREHKRFILWVAGALAVGLLLQMIVIGPARRTLDKDRQQLKVQRQELTRLLEDRGQPTDDVLNRAQEDLARLDKNVKALASDLAMEIPPDYRVPKNEKNPAFFFDTRFTHDKQELKRLAPKAGREGVRLPPDDKFGFNKPPGPKSAPEYLVRLALIKRLVKAAFDAPAFTAPVAEVTGIHVVTAGVGEDAKMPPADQFLQRHPIDVQVRTSYMTFLRFLHGLGQKGNFLALDRVKFVKEDHMAAVGMAEFSVSGLTFNLQGKLPGVKAEGEETKDDDVQRLFRR